MKGVDWWKGNFSLLVGGEQQEGDIFKYSKESLVREETGFHLTFSFISFKKEIN